MHKIVLVMLIGLSATAPSHAAERLRYRRPLTAPAKQCLHEILDTGTWRYSRDVHRQMLSVAVFAKANLDGVRRVDYIYVMNDSAYCGTAGCSMLIGEIGNDGKCHEIYSDSGSEVSIAVLARRDHGYHRLLTPCEVRFDGREYRQLHDACPNIDVQQ